MSHAGRFVMAFALVCALCAPASAQEGARISGFYSGAIGEGETNIGTGGSVGYRLTPRFGFDFEVLALPDLEIDDRGDGRGIAFLTNFVTEFPSPAAWLTPYIQGGGGVANLRFGSTFEFEDRDGRRIGLPFRGRRGGPAPVITDDMRLVRVSDGRSETNLALTIGGGVDFSVWRGLAVGPNITFMKFFGGQDTDLTRIGAKMSYRF